MSENIITTIDNICIYNNNININYYGENGYYIITNDKIQFIWHTKAASRKIELSNTYQRDQLNNNFLNDINNRINLSNTNNIYNIYVINLKSRQDRRDIINKLILEQNIFNINYFDAYASSRGCIGCAMSHMALIKYAKTNNLPFIIVAEDDNQFIRDFNEIKNIIDWLAENLDQWRVFNGNPTGFNISPKNLKKNKSKNSNLFYSNKGLLTNFMIYNKNS
jgi:hypothetical protein